MRIGGNFPVIPQTGSNSRHAPSTSTVFDGRQSSNAMALSTVAEFESASSAESERFFKVEGLSSQAKEALSAYQATESLSASNPRNLLIGVDVYA